MTAYHAGSVPVRALEARVRKFRGRLFVANASLAFELDEVAEFIFTRVDGVATVGRIGEQVAERYGVDAARATADTAELLAQLRDEGMLAAG